MKRIRTDRRHSAARRMTSGLCTLILMVGMMPAAFAEPAVAQPTDRAVYIGELASSAKKQTGPSVEDVRRFGAEITYPKRSSYLDEYETMYVNAPKKHSIYVYWKANGDATYLRGSYYFLKHGAEVTVLAREKEFSCVTFYTKNGKEHIGWVYTSMLEY